MPTRIDSADLRAAMSGFPTGVTVVTASGPAGPAGATANAVASPRRFSSKDPHPEKWDGVAWREEAGSPRIDSALIWLGCELRDVHDGGDHVIATGRVLALDATEGEPLLFHRGRYRPLAHE
jgi:flavin reductase (DIM6/NTAB) family NADH-FMN oxidoreductase RutF